MTLTPFYRRTLYMTLALSIAGAVVRNWPESTPGVVAPADTPARAEARLAQLRATAASIPAREEILKNAQADLATREKGLIVADTAAQAQAQLIQLVGELGRHENPPVAIRSTDSFGIRAARRRLWRSYSLGADRMSYRSVGEHAGGAGGAP